MRKKQKKRVIIALILIINLVLICFWLFIDIKRQLEVIFLDIGQGDSVLIKAPHGQNILIDGGPDNSVVKALGKELKWWDRTIDLLIVSHPDNDHIGGTIPVLERYKVLKVLHTGIKHSTPVYEEWKVIVQDKKIKNLIAKNEQIINLSKACHLNIIYPDKSIYESEFKVVNNSSIVTKLTCKNKKFLFAGDIEEETEKYLINKKINLKADVFKASHHGSDTSNAEDFLNLVKPEIVVIQVGHENNFGHPSLRVLKRLERLGAKVYRNDQDGVIKLQVINGKVLKVN